LHSKLLEEDHLQSFLDPRSIINMTTLLQECTLFNKVKQF